MKFGKPVAALVLTSGLVAACAISTNSSLDVQPEARFFAPGDTIKGSVVDPSGKITVALENYTTHELTTCTYSSGKKKFACPTSTDAEGIYVVGVTDARQPDRGTQKARVAVTGIEDYAPQVSVQEKAKPGEEVVVSLLMWGATRGVTVRVLDKAGSTIFTGKTTTAKDGGGKVAVKGLSAGSYTLHVADRLWTFGVPDSGKKILLAVAG